MNKKKIFCIRLNSDIIKDLSDGNPLISIFLGNDQNYLTVNQQDYQLNENSIKNGESYVIKNNELNFLGKVEKKYSVRSMLNDKQRTLFRKQTEEYDDLWTSRQSKLIKNDRKREEPEPKTLRRNLKPNLKFKPITEVNTKLKSKKKLGGLKFRIKKRRLNNKSQNTLNPNTEKFNPLHARETLSPTMDLNTDLKLSPRRPMFSPNRRLSPGRGMISPRRKLSPGNNWLGSNSRKNSGKEKKGKLTLKINQRRTKKNQPKQLVLKRPRRNPNALSKTTYSRHMRKNKQPNTTTNSQNKLNDNLSSNKLKIDSKEKTKPKTITYDFDFGSPSNNDEIEPEKKKSPITIQISSYDENKTNNNHKEKINNNIQKNQQPKPNKTIQPNQVHSKTKMGIFKNPIPGNNNKNQNKNQTRTTTNTNNDDNNNNNFNTNNNHNNHNNNNQNHNHNNNNKYNHPYLNTRSTIEVYYRKYRHYERIYQELAKNKRDFDLLSQTLQQQKDEQRNNLFKQINKIYNEKKDLIAEKKKQFLKLENELKTLKNEIQKSLKIFMF
ncbi:hypothetical protein M0812_04114 [Anaeramoeba flamelloides]|uniref:Uncharacterized protein n=1 Tax=Anaeramoeba flamelloides TaxID=1746091 RepID=A0AAV8ADJ0_9EUKA|nr:hypothetical protein M0812_04114 [Anaeramoeba flamelloides]